MFSRELKSPPRIAPMTDTAWKSGTRRGRPGMADPDLGLHRARPMDDADPPLGRRGAVDDLAGRRRPTPGADHAPKQVARHRDDVLAAEVAADDERRPRRVDGPGVGAPEHVGVEALDGLAGAARRSVVRRVGA